MSRVCRTYTFIGNNIKVSSYLFYHSKAITGRKDLSLPAEAEPLLLACLSSEAGFKKHDASRP